MKRGKTWAALFVGLAAVIAAAAAHACAVCVAGTGADDPLTDAFNWSVLFLMAMPYTVVGSIAAWLFYARWRASAKKRDGQGNKAAYLRLAWIHKESER
jgi:hypothetical protein